MRKILIIEDDKELREELKILLNNNDYEAEFLDKFDNVISDMIDANADMVLLDINLPGMNGDGILKSFRKQSDTPVIMVTSKNTEMDEVICMSLGADDFVTKPYNPTLLLLHIDAVFKRYGGGNSDVLKYEQISVDLGRGTLNANGEVIELSKNELGIISFLIKNKGKIVSRDEIINYLWDSEEFVDDNTLTVNINRLRKKLEECGMTDMIKTKRGQGYLLP